MPETNGEVEYKPLTKINTIGETPKIQSKIQSERPLSFGEMLVGIDFNVGNRSDIDMIKTKIAEIADLLNEKHLDSPSNYQRSLIYNEAVASLLAAQMMAVKYVTFKY